MKIEHTLYLMIYLSFRIPAPHIVAARAYKVGSNSLSPTCAMMLSGSCGGSSGSSVGECSNSQGSSTALYRLARLLNQTTKTSMNPIPKDDAPRRLSWER